MRYLLSKAGLPGLAFPEIFASAHYALLQLLVMSAISVLNAHFLLELELSMLICMTAVVVPRAPLCGTRTRSF